MELNHFIAISAYILALCGRASGATTVFSTTELTAQTTSVTDTPTSQATEPLRTTTPDTVTAQTTSVTDTPTSQATEPLRSTTADTVTAQTTSVTDTPTSQASGTSGPTTADTGTAEITSVTDTPTFQGTSTQSENLTCPPKPECSSSKGVQIGLIVVVVALLLHAVAITFLHIQLRRKVSTRTGKNGPDPYMDLQPRPEAGRTYQEMAITSTASSKKTGEMRLPSSDLVYENQNVAQYANKTKEGADYETVLTPN